MKLSIKTWSKTKKTIAAGVTTALVVAASVVGVGFMAQSTQAASCPSNDIMPCGASSRSTFISKLKNNNPSDMDNIYANYRYDLPKSQYDEFAKYAKAGRINPDNGNITVDGKTVGYDGLSLGRNPKSNSTKVTIDGKTYHQSHIKDLTKYFNDAMVLFDSKGNVQTVIMNLCGNPIKVTPNNPKYECKALTVAATNDPRTFNFSSSVSASNGASVTKVVYDFGDGTSKTETSPKTVVSHTYAQPGTYNAKVTAYVKTTFGRGEFPITVTSDCKKTITIKEVEKPSVSIDKKVDGVESKQVEIGQNFTYQLKVTNTGNVDLANVAVKDDAPANVQFISTDKGTIVDNKLVYVIASLKVAEVVNINITAKVTTYVPGAIVNNACVDAPAVPGSPDDCDDATVTVPKPKVPSVKIDKLVNGVESDQVEVGEVFTYTVKATNDGEIDLKNVVITDPAPLGVTMLTTDKGTIAGNVMSYTAPSMKIGESVTISITAKVNEYKPGTIVNTACVNAPEVNPSEPSKPDDCDDATVTVPKPKVPNVKIDKVVNGVENVEVAVGETFTYTLKATNVGETDLANVLITDPAPAHVQFLTTDKGTIEGNKLVYVAPSIKVGESVIITMTAKVTEQVEGSIKNTACVDAPSVPGSPDDCDDAYVTVKVPGKVEVCDPSTGNIIWVLETDASKYEPKDSPKCKTVPVCDPADGIIKDVKWVDKDKYEPVDSPKCVKMQVCIIADGTGNMVTISKDQFDGSKHSTNSADCRNVQVCRLSDKTIVTVKESAAHSSAYSTNLDDCKTVPQVLPATGAGGVAGLAAGVALLAGIAHRLYIGRKLARELQ